MCQNCEKIPKKLKIVKNLKKLIVTKLQNSTSCSAQQTTEVLNKQFFPCSVPAASREARVREEQKERKMAELFNRPGVARAVL